MDIVVLIIALLIILLGAELFTNGIEWFGRKLELAEGAVGSVLAAVGTALPETMIPIIAILFATGESSHAVGVGAILGAPFMLATLAMFVTGVAVLWQARKRPTGDVMRVDTGVLAHDMRYFAIAYAIAIGAAFLPLEPVWLKWIVAVVLIGIYAWYVKGHFEADPDVDASDLAPLRFRRLDRGAHRERPDAAPRLRVVNLQVLAALGLILVGAIFFVDAVEPPRDHARDRPRAARPGHRPDRDRAAREVQLDHLGPPGQGHAGDGQHHRARWSSSRRSRRSSRWSSPRAPGSSPRTRTSPSRRPASPSCRRPSSSSRWSAAAVLHGKGLLVGGVFYLVYLGLVIGSHQRRVRDPGDPLIYSLDRSAGAREC